MLVRSRWCICASWRSCDRWAANARSSHCSWSSCGTPTSITTSITWGRHWLRYQARHRRSVLYWRRWRKSFLKCSSSMNRKTWSSFHSLISTTSLSNYSSLSAKAYTKNVRILRDCKLNLTRLRRTCVTYCPTMKHTTKTRSSGRG